MVRVLLFGLAMSGQVTVMRIVGQVGPEPYGSIAQYGIAGALGVLLIRRYDSELERERAGRAKAEAQRDSLADRVMESVPLVAEVQRTMVPTLDRLATEVQHMRDLIDRLRPGG